MSASCPYRFVLEIRAFEGGRVLHRHTLSPDWEPAVEAARLAGLRQHGVWHEPRPGEPSLVPVWHEAVGQPLVHGVRVQMARDGCAWHADVPAAYFGDAARDVVAACVAAGQLTAEDRVRYAVMAYAVEPSRTEGTALRFTAADKPQGLHVRDRAFADLVARSAPCGDTDATDVDVVIPERVLDDVCALTRAAGERETGGVLLGHVCRDDARADVGVEVTAQVPARHTVGDAVKLTFTSDTWTAVRAAVALRNADELLLGWWHSHPARAWCKACPIERQRVCQLATGFLSAEDKALHRAMFPWAYTQALVVTYSAAGLETKLFGWRHGALHERGFRLRHDGVASSTARDSVRATAGTLAAACADGAHTTSAHPVSLNTIDAR